MRLDELIAVARGDRPADLVLRGGRVVNVFSGEIEEADVAVAGGRIAGVGPGYAGRDEVDLGGRFLVPGLIDAHVHIESSLVTPRRFARAVVPHGVTTVVTDPHEIGNVAGLAGIRFMIADAARSPLSVFVNASSCVPATHLATSGASLAAADLAGLIGEPSVLGLAEVMNFPGVVGGDPAVLAKIEAFAGRVIDGHCPGLTGRALNAYAAAGIGSDHECTTAAEAAEKLARGFTVYLREATNAHNLDALLPLVTTANERRFCLCTDDRVPADLLDEGSIDHLVRKAIAFGLDPMVALRLATLNAAEHFRLSDRGAIAPGRRADLVAVADLAAFRAERVWIAGDEVARDGKALWTDRPGSGAAVASAMRVDPAALDFSLPAGEGTVRVIGAVEDQIVTRHLTATARTEAGRVVADPSRDLAKLAVVERHTGSGRVGIGLVQGLGLQRGALAGTVAHDHHNLVVVGVDDTSMRTVARAVAETGGGLGAAVGDRVLATVPLPVGGLMSDEPIERVRADMDRLLAAARELGSPVHDPFMALSFLTLEVIPTLKVTDLGLIDVERFERVELFA